MPALYMDAVITPNRSLSMRGFRVLLGAMIAFNLLVCALMLALRAFFVPVFLGLDVLAVIVAFRASYRSGGLAERVQVSALEVRVLHEAGRRSRTVWSSPTAFTRISVERPGEPETRVRLQLSGRALTVAHALSPKERGAFAEALREAIREANLERHPTG
ncbi:MAG TPA: DUF2244 domain-containing protein [Caulobacteraceae bacterium]|jgi:uncharacterized membrane protein|nr:DUF2244 domain-containing protein [Caulobacteraceae bacterium]